jgi:predicted PurR-regulated permease PerM
MAMTTRSIQLTFFFCMFGIALILGFFIFQPYINVLVLAAIFAIIFYPLFRHFNNNWKGKLPGVAALCTVIVASLIIFVPLSLLGTQVYREATAVYDKVSLASHTEQDPLGDIAPSSNRFIMEVRQKIDVTIIEVVNNVDRYAQQTFGWVLNNVGQFSQGIATIGLGIFVWLLAFYYFLRDGHRLKELFIIFSPLSDKYDNEIVNRVVTAVKAVVGGSLIVAVLQGIAAGVGLWIFGVPAPAIWGSVSIIAALVPTVGTALVMIPAVGYLFILGQTLPAVGLLLWALIVVNLIDNFLRPKLMAKGINVHSLAILLSVLGGIAFFGPMGFLTGPIIVAMLAEFLGIYNKMVLHHDNDELGNNPAA